MGFSSELLDHPVIWRLAITLLHIVWQGALFGLAGSIAMLGLRHAAPQVRYLSLMLLFVPMAVCPIVTYCTLWTTPVARDAGHLVLQVADEGKSFRTADEKRMTAAVLAQNPGVESHVDAAKTAKESSGHKHAWSANAVGAENPGTDHSRYELLQSASGPWTSWLVVGWFAGVMALSFRLMVGLTRAEWLKRRGVRPLENSAEPMVEELCRRLGVWQAVRWWAPLHHRTSKNRMAILCLYGMLWKADKFIGSRVTSTL